jgi:hypothetical protein
MLLECLAKYFRRFGKVLARENFTIGARPELIIDPSGDQTTMM